MRDGKIKLKKFNMKETYNKKINRHTDWGGDESTGGLKVSGKRVQEFIKDELNSKVGAIYREPGGNKVHCFANDEDMEKYIASGTTSLIITSFELESKYKAKVNAETLRRSYSVIYGTEGNRISFQFKIVDDSDMVADSRATIEYSFLANGNVTGYTTEVEMMDDWTTINTDVIDKYLKKGQNTITVTITGVSTKASSQFIISYNLFDLSFSTAFNFNEVQYNVLSIPYTIECSDTKYLEFYIDGQAVNSNESMVIADVRKDDISTINISNLEPGTHSLQVGAYVKANDGTEFHTPYHYYTFAKYGSEIPSFLMSLQLGKDQPLMGGDGSLVLSMNQFDLLAFDWALYDARENKLNVVGEYDGEVVARAQVTQNGKISAFSFRPMNYGENKKILIYALGENDEKIFEHEITLNITESNTGIKETTSGLLLKLESNGRRNSDENKDVWSCIGTDGNEYHATFNNFGWNAQQGWDEETESLVISNGATVDFNIQPMLKRWEASGGTFEIDLETFDIDDDDAIICECKDNIVGVNSAYFRVTATNAEFSTANGVKINTRYKDNERLKIAFIGNKIGNHEDGNLIYIVVNGVLERAALYESFDSITSTAYLRIGNPEGKCKVRLRSIRIYSKAITVDEAFNNFVVDSNNVQEIYEKNNILKPGTTEVGFDEVANKLPVMIFTGDMEELARNGMDKEWRYFDVEYINRQHPELNFVSFNCQMKLQGTSSLGYPRKNFKLKTKDKYFTAETFAEMLYEIDPTSPVGNKRLRNKITGELVDFGEITERCITLGVDENDVTRYIPLKKGKYRFKKGSHKADKWTLKADFMESSCSHNVAAGRSWNDIFENTKFDLTNSDYKNHTYDDSALVSTDEYITYTRDGVTYRINNNAQSINSQKDYVCRTDAQKICKAENADDIRTAVDGFPMVCFYRTSHQSNDLVFMGQYNFINDKSSYEVFGFEDIEDPTDTSESNKRQIYDASKVECWEGLKNANPISLFQTIKDWTDKDKGWASTYESRYPDTDDYGVAGKRWYNAEIGSPLYELSKWLVSTRHSGDTIYDLEGNVKSTSDTITIDASFAKRINGYQYGYTEDTKDSYGYAEGTVADTAVNRQKKFETEKWEHFDVWKLAGYYIYLMRYGAVDQFVKNTMLFTDGNGKYDPRTDNKYRKWFFINYDNDCLFGLRNNGELAFHWKLDRQTLDGASDIIHDEGDEYTEQDINTYAMMGHDSTLWNNLEADDEFMRMVRDLDNAMSSYGLNYDNMVTEFDTNQTEQWCERIYNANERYKYIQAAKGIGDMAGNPVNNLWMLQGTRRSHRHWWIANHFNLLNAKWLSGDYKATRVRIKTDAPAGTTIRAVAGTDYYFAWGQKKIYESNMERAEGEAINFTFPTNQVQGDPVDIYAINKLSEIDFSDLAYNVRSGSFEFHIPDTNVSNLLKKLVIGNPAVVNRDTGMGEESWVCLKNLEYLDITNYLGIKTIPLSSFPNLHTLKARGSGISTFSPREGSIYDLVELPQNMASIELRDIKFANNINTDLKYTPNINLKSLAMSNSSKAGLGKDYFDFVEKWINEIESSDQKIEIYRNAKIDLSNINWNFNNLNKLRLFKNFKLYADEGNFSLKGKIDITACGALSRSNIEEIKSIFGENCFNEKMSALFIKTPSSIFIVPESEDVSMVAGQTFNFSYELYPDVNSINIQSIEYNFVEKINSEDALSTDIYDPIEGIYLRRIYDAETLRSGLTVTTTFNENTGTYLGSVTCPEIVVDGTYESPNGDMTVIVMVTLNTLGDGSKVSYVDLLIKNPTYAVDAELSGERNLYMGNTYNFDLVGITSDNKLPLGTHDVVWSLEGEGLTYVANTAVTNNTLSIQIVSNNQPESYSSINLSAVYTNHDSGSTVIEKAYTLLVLNENVIMTNETNPVVMSICNANAWAANAAVMLKSEAEAVTSIGTAFSNINATFSFKELKYFTGLTSLAENAFANSNITEISLPVNINSLGAGCFDNCQKLKNVVVNNGGNEIYTLPNGINSIPEKCFNNCKSLDKLRLPLNVTYIGAFAFGNTNIKHILLGTEALVDNSIVLPDIYQDIRINGKAFDAEYEGDWAPGKSTNKLETISIPRGIQLLSNELLWSKELKTIIVHEDCPNYIVENGVLYTKSREALIRCVAKGEYKPIYYVDDITTRIVKRAFYAVDNLDTLIIDASIAAAGIEDGAFENSKIKRIDFSACNLIVQINRNTFSNCENLIEVILPPNLEDIKTYAFSNCTSLTGITIPDTVKTMESYSIDGCPNITSLVFPSECDLSVDSIVRSCGNLTTVTLSIISYEKENSGGRYELYNSNGDLVDVYTTYASAKKDMEVGGRIEKISEGESVIVNSALSPAFISGDCRKLIEYKQNELDDCKQIKVIDGVIYNANVTTLIRVPYALRSYVMPDTVLSYEVNTFVNSSLTALTLSKNITRMDLLSRINIETLEVPHDVFLSSAVFEGCKELRTIYFYGKVTSEIPEFCFADCDKLEEVKFFKGVTGTIRRFAFRNDVKLGLILMGNKVAPIIDASDSSSTEVDGHYEVYDSSSSLKGTYSSLKNALSYSTIVPNGYRVDVNSDGTYNVYGNGNLIESGVTSFERIAQLGAFKPGWRIDIITEGIMVADFHPFGYTDKQYVGYSTSGPRKLYLPYNYTGYDAQFWQVPLLNSRICNFTIEYFNIGAGEMVVKLYKNGTLYTGVAYAKSESGNYRYNASDSVASATYDASKGGHVFNYNNNLYEGEEVSFYTDMAFTDEIGTANVTYGQDEYQVGEPLMGLRSTKGSPVLSSSADETVTITKSEYETLVSKVNNLIEIMSKLN